MAALGKVYNINCGRPRSGGSHDPAIGSHPIDVDCAFEVILSLTGVIVMIANEEVDDDS